MQTKMESYRVITTAAVGLLALRSLVLKYKLKKASKSYVYRTEMVTGLIKALLCASGRVTARCWIQLKNMLDETCQNKYIRSDSCYTTGRKAQRSGPGREIRGGCKKQDDDRVMCAVSSSVVSLHYETKAD